MVIVYLDTSCLALALGKTWWGNPMLMQDSYWTKYTFFYPTEAPLLNFFILLCDLYLEDLI